MHNQPAHPKTLLMERLPFFLTSMRRFAWGLSLVLILLSGSGNKAWAQCWEWQNPLPTGNALWDVFFVDEQTGWAVGGEGTILKTTNGGAQWAAYASGTTVFLRSVYFTDGDTGWAVGQQGTILKTSNGGATWTAQSSGTTSQLLGCYFTDGLTGWVAGLGGAILKTLDGGVTWIPQNSGTTDGFRSIYFINSQVGWAVAISGTIVKTENGGSSWTTQTSGTSVVLQGVYFTDNTTGWVVGSSAGTILKTVDGGETWIPKPSGATEGLWSVFFTDGLIGWAVGDAGMILKTEDGGETWDPQTSGTAGTLYSVHFTDAQTGWVVGGNGVILKTTNGGTTWSAQNSGTTNQLKAAHFTDNQTGWTSGTGGTILKTTNGGTTWALSNQGTVNFHATYFFDHQTGWMVGELGNILKTTNGGTNWTYQDAGTGQPLLGIHCTDSLTGWVVGANGIIRKTTDGGNQWNAQTSGTIQWLHDTYFVGSQIGWAVGEGGTILKTTNGGTDWNPQSSGVTEQFYGVCFADDQTGWAVGSNGKVLKTTNGGMNWGNQVSGTSATLQAVYFTNNQMGWAVGSGGAILKTTDGGMTWAAEISGTANALNDVHFTDAQTGWAVGDGGTILKYNAACASTCRTTDSLALVALHTATDGPNWTNKWNLAQPINTWYGVTLNAMGCVQKIVLVNNNLNGALPNLNLSELEDLNLNSNQLTGSIPDFTLPNLRFLTLFTNKLTGNIPNFNLPNLEELHIGSNQLSGSIPNFNLPLLQFLALPDNQLSGNIPNFDLLPSLNKLSVEFNKLTGNIPDFTNLPNLQTFFCGVNQLSGSIPNFSNLSKLEFFSCFLNQLSGSVPNFNLPNLVDFYCAYNQLSGSIPDLNLPKLGDFRANNNQISGLVQFTKMPTLTANTWPEDSLTLYSNKLTFEDILPNITLINSMVGRAKYAPQDSIYADTTITRSAGQSLTIDLGIDAAVGSNVYLWKKSGGSNLTINGSNQRTFSNLSAADAGDYHVEVTNPDAPDLTLYSRKITLNVSSNCRTTDSLALVALHTATNGSNWTQKWNLAQPINTWYGVSLNAAGCVDSLIVHTNNLNGVLPDLNLPNLECLDLSANNLSGPIPNFNLPNLKSLYLAYSQLAGRIPNFNLPNLEILNLFGNQLSDTIPDFDLPNLKQLNLYDNQLSGNIPNLNLPKLEALHLAYNQLTGAIPNLNLPLLEDLLLSGNQLSGSVPDFDLPELGRLYLSYNRLTALPALTQLPSLGTTADPFDSLVVYNNRLTFKDILPNLPLIAAMSGRADYAPQDSIFSDTTITRSAGQTLTIDLGIDAAIGSNVYLWKKSGGNDLTITGNNQRTFSNLSAADAGDYHVEVTNPNAPDLTLYSRKITLSIGCTTVSNSLPDTALCQGMTLLFNNQTITQAGTYQDTLTTPAGCDSVLIQKVFVNPLPVANAGQDTTICNGQIVNLIASGGESYQWSNSQSGAIAMVNKVGTYTVTATDSKGCTGTDEVNINSRPLLKATIAPPTVITCLNPQIILDATGSDTAFVIISWNTLDGNIVSGANTLKPVVNKAGTYILTVNPQGVGVRCTNADTITVTGNTTLPAADAGTAAPICQGQTASLTATGGTGYVWSNGATTAATSVTAAGTYTVTVTDGNGCTATDQVQVTVNPLPAADAGTATPICQGQTASLTATGGTGFAWSNGATTAATSTATGGTYTVTVTDGNGCTATDQVQVTVNPLPTADAGTAAPICQGQTANLTASGGTDYAWSNGATTAATSVTAAGTYTVTVTDGNGCTAADQVQVTVNQTVTAQIAPAAEISCKNPQVPLDASGSTTGLSVFYQWTALTGGHIVTGNATAKPVVDQAGIYILKVEDGMNGCFARDTVQVVGDTLSPLGMTIGVGSVSCAGKTDGEIKISQVQGGKPPFRYSLDGGPWQDSPTFGGLAPGLYDLGVIGANECNLVSEATLNPTLPLSLSLLEDQSARTDSTATLRAVLDNEQGTVTWQWSGPGLLCTDCPAPVVKSQISDYIRCTVTDSKGCTATAQMYVLSTYTPPGEPIPPNDIISVDPDTGEPDPFVFPDLEQDPDRYRNNDIVIFNRWGQVVYKAAPYLNDWKGTDQGGSPLPEGTYYYVLTLKDGVKAVIHGNVLLIR